MYILSEGGRYDSWIALPLLDAERSSLRAPCVSRACSYPISVFLLSHFPGLWRSSCVGTGVVNILSLCWVARLQRKMNIQGKGMGRGRGSVELFGDPGRSSTKMKRIIWGNKAVVCIWDEIWVGSAVSDQLQPEKMAEGINSKIRWQLPSYCLQGVHSWAPAFCDCMQWVWV